MNSLAATGRLAYRPWSLPPVNEARTFLTQLYGGERRGLVYLADATEDTTPNPRPGEADRIKGKTRQGTVEPFDLSEPDALSRMARRAVEVGNVMATNGIYRPAPTSALDAAAALLSSRRTWAGVMGQRPRRDHLRCARSAVCDFDGPATFLMAEVERQGLRDPLLPSLLVSSGSVTDGWPHFHAVFRLDRPVDADELATIQGGLTDHFKADADFLVSHVRVPGCRFPNKAGELHQAQVWEAVTE